MSTEQFPYEVQRYITATIDAIGRTGASATQIRYSDDEEPVVWLAVATWTPENLAKINEQMGEDRPIPKDGAAEAMAGMDPVVALYRLLEVLVDGGVCAHCGQPTAVVDPNDTPAGVERLTQIPCCWWRYSAKHGKWRPGCDWMRPDKVKLP